MKFFRISTSFPIRVLKISFASIASSMLTCRKIRSVPGPWWYPRAAGRSSRQDPCTAGRRRLSRQELRDLLHLLFLIDVFLLLSLRNAEEGRLGDVDVPGLDEFEHVAVEERQEERPYMGAVHIGIGHDYDVVVPCPFGIELLPDARADGGDQGLDLGVLQDLVFSGFLHVEDLSPQREDGLEFPVPALLWRSHRLNPLPRYRSRSLPDRVPNSQQVFRADPELSRELFRRARSRAFRGCLAGFCRRKGLFNDNLEHFRVFIEIFGECRVDQRIDNTFHAAVPEAHLGLPLELGVGHLDRDY